MILLEAPWQKCVWLIEQIYKRYRSFQLLINASGGIVQCEYVVMWTEIESLVSQCVVSLGLYQCLNSRTPYTDSPPRELIRTHPLTNCENQWRYWSMLIMLPKLILLCGRFSAAVPSLQPCSIPDSVNARFLLELLHYSTYGTGVCIRYVYDSPFPFAVLELLHGVAEHVFYRPTEGHPVLLVHVKGQQARWQHCSGRKKKQVKHKRIK